MLNILDDEAGILVTGKGIITIEDMLGLYDEIYSSPQAVKKQKYRFNDLLSIEGSNISPESIKQIAQEYKKYAEIIRDQVLAAAVKADLGFGLCRMWETHADNSQTDTMISRENQPAVNWLRETVRIKFGIGISNLIDRDSQCTAHDL